MTCGGQSERSGKLSKERPTLDRCLNSDANGGYRILPRSTRYRLETHCRPTREFQPADPIFRALDATAVRGKTVRRRLPNHTSCGELSGALVGSGWLWGWSSSVSKDPPPHAFHRIPHRSTSPAWGRTWGSSRGILPCLTGGNPKRAMALCRARAEPPPPPETPEVRCDDDCSPGFGNRVGWRCSPWVCSRPRWGCDGRGRSPIDALLWIIRRGGREGVKPAQSFLNLCRISGSMYALTQCLIIYTDRLKVALYYWLLFQ